MGLRISRQSLCPKRVFNTGPDIGSFSFREIWTEPSGKLKVSTLSEMKICPILPRCHVLPGKLHSTQLYLVEPLPTHAED